MQYMTCTIVLLKHWGENSCLSLKSKVVVEAILAADEQLGLLQNSKLLQPIWLQRKTRCYREPYQFSWIFVLLLKDLTKYPYPTNYPYPVHHMRSAGHAPSPFMNCRQAPCNHWVKGIFFLLGSSHQSNKSVSPSPGILHLQPDQYEMRWKSGASVETCPDAENDLFNVEPEYLDFFRKTQNFCKLESELLEKDGKRLHGNKCWNFWY